MLTPSELANMQEAELLLDAACRAARLTLTPLQRDQARSALEIGLDDLRRAWRRRWEERARDAEEA